MLKSRRSKQGERGVTLLFVIIVMPVMMVTAAIAVDLAGARSDSVELQAAADSGALGAVPDLPAVSGGSAATAVASAIEFAQGNMADTGTWSTCSTTIASSTCRTDGTYEILVTSPYSDGVSTNPSHRRIRVRVCRPSREVFASAAGLTSPTLCRSAVAGASSGSLGGLRPFGVCSQANAQIIALMTAGTIPSAPVQIAYGKADVARCGATVPGNWGLIDFNGGSNSNAETQSWVASGYPGSVTKGTAGLACPGDTVGCYPGDTGAISNSLSSGLASLVASGEVFGLPVFDAASGNGANAQFHIVGFISVRLTGYQVTGSQASRSLTLQIVSPGLVAGDVCCQTGTALEG